MGPISMDLLALEASTYQNIVLWFIFSRKATMSSAQTLTIYYSIDNMKLFPVFQERQPRFQPEMEWKAALDMKSKYVQFSACNLFQDSSKWSLWYFPIYIDNLQIAASYMNISHGIKFSKKVCMCRVSLSSLGIQKVWVLIVVVQF
ncbi:MAG: hypothetical protein IPN88_15200 [Bacteroidetes bacterium]|nr:hypothetical protein [Bacteroidota bacterium]